MATNGTCGPVWALQVAGTIAGCTPTIRIHSATWVPRIGNTGDANALILEDLQGREIIHMRASCDVHRTYPTPLQAQGLFLRTISGGTLYLQVD